MFNLWKQASEKSNEYGVVTVTSGSSASVATGIESPYKKRKTTPTPLSGRGELPRPVISPDDTAKVLGKGNGDHQFSL